MPVRIANELNNLNRFLQRESTSAKDIIDDIEYSIQKYDYDVVIIYYSDCFKVIISAEDIGCLSTCINPNYLEFTCDGETLLIPINNIDEIKLEFKEG